MTGDFSCCTSFSQIQANSVLPGAETQVRKFPDPRRLLHRKSKPPRAANRRGGKVLAKSLCLLSQEATIPWRLISKSAMRRDNRSVDIRRVRAVMERMMRIVPRLAVTTTSAAVTVATLRLG